MWTVANAAKCLVTVLFICLKFFCNVFCFGDSNRCIKKDML